MQVYKPQRPQSWLLALLASVVLHVGIAGSLQQGWLSLGGNGAASSGGVSWGAGDLAIPLNLSDFSSDQPSDTPRDQTPPVDNAPPLAPKPSESASAAEPRAQLPAGLQESLEPKEPLPPLDPIENEVALGIDDGSKDATDWLGASKATEHAAMLSSVNQPAWSLTPGLPTPLASDVAKTSTNPTSQEAKANEAHTNEAQTKIVQPNLSSSSNTKPAQTLSPAQQLPPQGQSSTTTVGPSTNSTVTTHPLEISNPAPQAQPKPEEKPLIEPKVLIVDELATPIVSSDAIVQAQREQPLQVNESPASAPPAQLPPVDVAPQSQSTPLTPAQVSPVQPTTSSSPLSQPASTAPTGGGTTGNRPGDKSDAESIATSTIPTLNFRPGTPLAAEGVRIRTITPKFSITSRVASRPRSPVLELTFSREGKVIAGKFVEGRTSGYDDIDGPILDAAMRWTATGKKLQELTANDPKATLTVRITYLLQ